MVTQRTEGLYRLFLLCQIIIVALLFWFGVWVTVTFYSPGAGAPRLETNRLLAVRISLANKSRSIRFPPHHQGTELALLRAVSTVVTHAISYGESFNSAW